MNTATKSHDLGSLLESELEVLLRVAKRLTLNDADAEDVVGATIMAAFKAWHGFDGRHVRSWLIRILRNEWLMILRRRNVRREVALEAAGEPEAGDFWQAIDTQILHEKIRENIDGLAEDYRLAITLCDIESLSYEEASLALDIPLGTLQSRLFRARKQLRQKLYYLHLGNAL